MGFMESILGGLKLEGGESFEDDGYLDEPDTSEDLNKVAAKNDPQSDDARKPAFAPKPAPKSRKLGNGMEVCVIKPTSVDDAREITETLLSNRTVVLNMEGLDVDIAQRIIDFTSGSTYAIHGNLQKISHYIFIITPQSVDISGDFATIMNGSFDVPQF